MRCVTRDPRRLEDSQLEAWSAARQCQSAFDSPFLAPEFALAVAEVRDDVEVAQFDDGQAWLAYQRQGRTAVPVGGRLSDYQALLARPEWPGVGGELVASCALDCWRFDHLLDPQGRFAAQTRFRDESPYLDLSAGFAEYRAARLDEGHRELRETERKGRRLERELGELEFRWHDPTPEAFAALLDWKSAQYRRSRITDVFSFPWTARLLRLLAERRDGVRGELASLRAGGRLLAVHYGLRERGVLHYWFPAYDPERAEGSPGRVLLWELIRRAPDEGVRKLDLGRGVSRQKSSLMSGATPVGIGEVERRAWRRVVVGSWRRAREWLRTSPLRGPLRLPARAAYRLKEWIEFR